MGIALGLVFSLSAVTFHYVQTLKLRGSALEFARKYAEVLGSHNVADAYWYQTPPPMRKGKTPKGILDNLQKNEGSMNPMIVEEETAPIKMIHDVLTTHDGTVEVEEVEQVGFDRLTPYAFVVLKVAGQDDAHADQTDPTAGHDHEDGPQYAMVELRSLPDSPTFDWYVVQLLFPYELHSHELAVEPVDDGHGHGH